jgi:hypothetical protein
MTVLVSVPYQIALPALTVAESAVMNPSSVEVPAVQLPNVIVAAFVPTDGVAAVAAFQPAAAIVCLP